MKYNISVDDCKFTERQLDEIFSLGGIPSPQDGSFRFKNGTVSEEYIAEKERIGYRVRRGRDYVEFAR